MRPLLRRLRLLPLLAPLGLAAPLAADEVLLTGGTRLTGTVLGQDEAGVRLLSTGGQEWTIAAGDVKQVTRDPDAPAGTQVLRYARAKSPGQPQGLQTALIHLRHPKTGRRVDLVGAVHIADPAYYREVQRLLEQVDTVLYEMVKPRDAKPGEAPPEETGGLRALQAKMATWFGLAFQLDAIAYGRPHFVHADLTVEEFLGAPGSEAVTDKMGGSEGMLKLVEGLLAGVLRGEGPEAQRRQRTLKAMLGQMLGSMGDKMSALLGEEISELLLTKRNEVCVKRLTELPEQARSVAIFYGAAHLPDLETRLRALGYERAGARWLTAWDTTLQP